MVVVVLVVVVAAAANWHAPPSTTHLEEERRGVAPLVMDAARDAQAEHTTLDPLLDLHGVVPWREVSGVGGEW